mmetsp:Transcript_54434/g.90482  ORF Transcript_54434/g.90482 Transcript_54434/m.90482 type:complete len:299 (+) Transcript_54434:62-958(+)
MAATITHVVTQPPDTAMCEDPFSQLFELEKSRREIRYQLRQGLCKIKGRFSYCRLEGITQLLKLVLVLRDLEMELFAKLQSDPELNVMYHIFTHVLVSTSVSAVSSVSSTEKQLALELVQGCCLLASSCKTSLREMNGMELLLNGLTSGDTAIQVSTLFTLLAAMVDSQPNQKLFLSKGMETVLSLFKDSRTQPELRNRCGEFLLLFAGYVDELASDAGVADYREVSANEGMIRLEVERQLGHDLLDVMLSKDRFSTMPSLLGSSNPVGEELVALYDKMYSPSLADSAERINSRKRAT